VRKVFIALAALTVISATPTTAFAQDGSDLTEQCYANFGAIPVFGEKACRSVHQFVKGFGRRQRSRQHW
jgi:hypothetical protein